MWKLFDNDNLNLRSDVRSLPLVNFIAIVVFLGIVLVLASRAFGLAKDDYNYLNYFYYAQNIDTDNLLLYFIEEPLWRLITSSTVLFLTPENGLRFTMFISASLFLFSMNRVNRGLFLLVAIAFVLHQHFSTQMYFNQLRQGLALSLFLFSAIYWKRPLIGAILATLIHTSFIFPLFLIILITKIKSIKWIMFYSVIGVIALYLSVGLLDTFDLGRRASSYEFEGKFTVNFYISTFIRYVPLLLLIQFYGHESKYSFWYKLALSSFIIIVPFTLFYNAAGRLMYYISAFFLLMLLEQSKSLGGKIGLVYYFLFLFIDLLFFESSVLSDWELILGI